MANDINILRDALTLARQDRCAKEAEIEKECRASISAIEARHHAELLELRTIEAKADALFQEAWDAAKIAEAKPEYPVGTILQEWRRRKFDYHGPLHPTGRKGVVEIVTRDSRFAAGRISPSCGTVICRLLRKDGTPGMQFEHYLGLWHPDGVNPNQK